MMRRSALRLAVGVGVCLGVAGAAHAQDIKVEGALGTLDEAAARQVISAHDGELLACFTGNQSRYVGGSVRLVLRVGVDGRVKRVAAESELGAWAVERCMLGVARGLRFARPRGGEAEVALPLSFVATSPAADGDGEELAGKLGTLRGCPGGPRSVRLVAYVGPGGKVTSAGFSSAEPVSDRWGDCAAERARRLKLADPRGRMVKVAAEVAR